MELNQLYQKFPTQLDCIEFLEKIRWDGKPVCPHCNSTRQTSMPKEKRHKCNACNKSYSVLNGTFLHETKIPLQNWFYLLLLSEIPSSQKLADQLSLSKNSAWKMITKFHNADPGLIHKLRTALTN